MIGERVDRVGASCEPSVDRDVVERLEHGALVVGHGRDVEPRVARGVDRGEQTFLRCCQLAVGRHPAAHDRLGDLAGQQLEPIDVDPATLGDDPLQRPIGPSLRRTEPRIDVEDLAATDRLVTARFTQHEPITRQEGERFGEEQTHGTRGTRRQRLRAQHSDLDG